MNRRRFLARLGGSSLALGFGSQADRFYSHGGSRTDPRDYPYRPVDFTAVRLTEGFWAPRLETNRSVTLPTCFNKCRETGRLLHFDLASGAASGPYEGKRYDDSDVFKVVEGASYTLNISEDPELDDYLDRLIARIAAAQEPDGYLYTTRTANPEAPADTSPGRWSDLAHGHELYNAGHLYEAAVAHYLATGKRTLLEVAIRNADLIERVFGPGKRPGVPGHQEIEIGLVKLYRATGLRKYLQLARFFVDQRGRADVRELFGSYSQDHLPIHEQSQAVGHCVRAGYFYSGVADVAAISGDASYVAAIDRLWEDVVTSKLYVTGGLGAERRGEQFGDPYVLPNAEAYAETCASIANMMWNHRLFLLHGEAKYLDVMERTLYNGFLAGISLEGDRFFYPNPLASNGKTPFNQGFATRAPWFSTACCPTNICRFLPSLSGYQYAVRDRTVFVCLFLSGRAQVPIEGDPVTIRMHTDYPWSGNVILELHPGSTRTFEVNIRVPGWAYGQPVPSHLYRYMNATVERPGIKLNDDDVPFTIESGFIRLNRPWQNGDRLHLHFPMPVRRTVSHPRVAANEGKVALERGPIVYCLEGADNGGALDGVVLADRAPCRPVHQEALLGGVTVLRSEHADGSPLTAIPYYAWSHRNAGEMMVWIPRVP